MNFFKDLDKPTPNADLGNAIHASLEAMLLRPCQRKALMSIGHYCTTTITQQRKEYRRAVAEGETKRSFRSWVRRGWPQGTQMGVSPKLAKVLGAAR